MYPTTRRNYTDEFKIQAVALAETLGRTEAARQLEMSVKTLDNWANASRSGLPLSSPDRRAITKEDSELARLRAENAELKLERNVSSLPKFGHRRDFCASTVRAIASSASSAGLCSLGWMISSPPSHLRFFGRVRVRIRDG